MQGGCVCCDATAKAGFSRNSWLELIVFLCGNNDTSAFSSQEHMHCFPGITKHGVVGWPVGLPAAHPAALSLPPSIISWKRSWVELKRGRSLTSYAQRQNTFDLGEVNLAYCKLKYTWEINLHELHPTPWSWGHWGTSCVRGTALSFPHRVCPAAPQLPKPGHGHLRMLEKCVQNCGMPNSGGFRSIN